AVDVRLGLRQAREDGEGALAYRGVKCAAGEEVADRSPGPMSVVPEGVGILSVRGVRVPAMDAHLELRGSDGGALGALGPDLDAVQPERAHRVAHALDRQAEVEQGSHGHVTADA